MNYFAQSQEPASLGEGEFRQSGTPIKWPQEKAAFAFPYETKQQIEFKWSQLVEAFYKKELSETRKLLIGRISTVCGGDPIILGTRITVANIIEKYMAGKQINDILNDYPHLNERHIKACLEYYEGNRKEIDSLIAEDQALEE
jgi:uncharacterized protein (DUF433 family)